MKLKFANALSLALIVAMLFTSVALASDVDVAVIDVTVPTNSVTLTPGASGNITINISVTGNQAGTATFEVYRDWTLSGGSFAGTNPQEFTVGPRGGGDPATTFSTSGTVTIAAGQSAGNFTLAVGAFDITNSNTTGGKLAAGDPSNYHVTVSVPAPPTNTAPSVSVTGVADGASYNKGSVPTAMCDVTDTEDGPSSFAATLSAITGPYASDGIGSQTASCSYTDAGGLTASASAGYSIVDPSAPSVNYTLNPASPDGNNGWYKGNVTLTWNVSEPESPSSLQKIDCVDQNITLDQAEVSYSCSATSAGGSSGTVTVSIKRDGTMPSITASRTPAANSFGWNNTAVTASYEASDALSGLASNATGSFLFDQEGANQSHTFTVDDMAGNSASATVSGVNIDMTAPVVTVTGVTDGATYTLGSVPAAGCSTTDALSGVETAASPSLTGGPVGSVTASCSGALDKAGNAGSASATYNVIYNWNGFFQPIDNLPTLNKAKAGSAIPVKFSLSGNQGLNILAAGYPVSTVTACGTTTTDTIETTVTAGSSTLSYDALADQYVYVWKTDKSWTGCRTLTVKLADGTLHQANFNFVK